MTPAQGLSPLALALALTIAMPGVHAAGAGAGSREPYPASANSVSATASLASQYIWRGIGQSDGRPVGQLSLDYRHASGWSAGTWASSIGDRAVIADARGTGYIDVGVKHDMGGAIDLNLHAGGIATAGRVAGSGNVGMDWRDIKAGLSRKFEGGWALSGTYSRAFGNGAFERYASAMPRTDLRPLQGSRSPRGAVVMTLSRRF